MAVFINTKAGGAVETVDSFEIRREAREMLKEYQISAPCMGYYLSTRATQDWRDSNA